jgi:hypothetical protein
MAVNRYDTPARSEFINTYVPIPFEQMVAAGQVQQQRYDQAAAALDQKLADAANLKAIPNTRDYEYIQGIQGTMRDIADQFSQKDLANPIVRRQLNSAIRQGVDPSRVRAIQDSFGAWTAQQQHKAKLTAAGKYNQFIDLDPALSRDFDSRSGVYNYLTPTYNDPRIAAERYFNNIKPTLTDRRTPEGYGIREISRGKINEVISEKWRDFYETPEGQNMVTSRTPQTTTTSGGDEELARPSLSYTQQVSLAGAGERSKDIRKNIPSVAEATGAAKPGGFLKKAARWFVKGTGLEDEIDSEFEESIKGDEEALKNYNDLKSQAVEYFGAESFKNLNPKEEYKIVQEYIDDVYTSGNSIVVSENNIGKYQKESQLMFFGEGQGGGAQAINRDFYDPTDPIGTVTSYEDLLEEYPEDQFEYKIIGPITNNNPAFPAGRQVGIFGIDDKDNRIGPVHSMFMSADIVENQANEFAWDVHQINYQLLNTRDIERFIPSRDGGLTKITGTIDRSDKKVEGKMQKAFKATFKVQGPDGPLTINIGSTENPMRTTEQILYELQAALGENFAVK